jgi:uncharacterized protein with HEPN domain
MRERVRDKGRLEHMLNAIDRVLGYMEGKSFDDLPKDKIEYYGIVKCIEIVGEAAYKLSKEFKMSNSSTPWNVIEKMRHVLVHDYYMIDENEVKYVIEDDLRPLREQIAKYIKETDWEQWENK